LGSNKITVPSDQNNEDEKNVSHWSKNIS
jgi:hypothetical protein